MRWVVAGAVFGAGLLVLPGCRVDDDDDTDVDPEGTPPIIEHEPVPDGQPAMVEVDVECSVTDDEDLSAVTLYFRVTGTEAWNFAYMYETEESGHRLGKISAQVVTSDGVDYYIRAVDAGVPRAEETAPSGAPENFHHFSVAVLGESLPFFEDWEAGSLGGLGWTVVVDGFPDYEWEQTDTAALSGDNSVMHKEGINEISALKDWLISPPLEFDGETDMVVNWWEAVVYGGDVQVHQLWVSMGSPDPEDGDFQLVADLTAPEDDEAWTPSDLHDITGIVTAGIGYVAFYYEGEYPADRWYLDDVYVGEPIPRFELVDVTVAPTNFDPGDTVDLTITVENVALVDSLELEGRLGSDDGELSFPTQIVDYGIIEAFQTSSGAGAFEMTVAVEHPHNAYLALTLTLDDGEHSWDLPFEILMGEETYAEVDYDATDTDELTLTVGHGDPAAPAYETSTEVANAAGTWTTAITSEAAYLPPGPGEERWWLRVDNDGLYPATIDAYSILWGGTPFVSDEAPIEVLAMSSAVIYLPPLPVIEATAVFTNPDPVAPGDTGVEVVVEVTNQGTVSTAGPLTGTLTSAEADVSNITGTDLEFGEDPLGFGDSATNATSFTFDVDAGHTSDDDLEFTLVMSDGVDSFDVPFAVEVPWASVGLEELIIDDSDGNSDSIIDEGETVMLTAALRNTGDFSTAGPVSVTLAINPASQATVTLLDDHQDLNVALDAGQPHLEPGAFEMRVDQGYMGDSVILDVVITDGQDTWTGTYSLEVTQRAWTTIAGSYDAIWDNDGGVEGNSAYMFDIAELHYKTDGQVLWLKTDSYTPFDISTLWLTWVFYDVPNWWRMHFLYSDFKLYDDWFDGRFAGDEVTPTEPIVWSTEQDGQIYSFIFRVLLEDMEVDGQSLRLGMFAGPCAFSYYCDTAPDLWFYLDLANAQYGQDSDLLYVFTW